ncbi:hypothetical protein FA95DRAFT_109805 [Auriscalpium vulgare]|uniref:Uncharacterized protein n=1 Tax=Auriscalpium vulgare TaxID=40419 RepID=A0ACB8S6M5_9AGAM|nr:hypothetical protein FA95DRAFT_109805 [Auriscalpium vulgare]
MGWKRRTGRTQSIFHQSPSTRRSLWSLVTRLPHTRPAARLLHRAQDRQFMYLCVLKIPVRFPRLIFISFPTQPLSVVRTFIHPPFSFSACSALLSCVPHPWTFPLARTLVGRARKL